jgi:hypothetical protein
MKKLFLIALLLPLTTYSTKKLTKINDPEAIEKLLKEEKEQFNNPEYLKFILGNKLDLHFYGVSTRRSAKEKVQEIHNNLVTQLKQSKNHFEEAGKSLATKPDAVIVNTCATIEQRLRKNGKYGLISGKDLLRKDSLIADFFGSPGTRTFDGEIFFINACLCDFYQYLPDEELEQLRKGTQN